MRPHHLSQQSARIPILDYRIFEMLVVIEKDSIFGLMQGFFQQEPPSVVGRHRNHNKMKKKRSPFSRKRREKKQKKMRRFSKGRNQGPGYGPPTWKAMQLCAAGAGARIHGMYSESPLRPHAFGGLTLQQDHSWWRQLTNTLEGPLTICFGGGYVQSALCECPNRAGCILNRAGTKKVRRHDQFRGLRTIIADGISHSYHLAGELGGFCSLVVAE